MRLLDLLQQWVGEEQSLFRAQLLREDIARLEKLQELARSAADPATFKQRGMRLGWTPGDVRTHEIRAPIERLLEAVYALEAETPGPENEGRVEAAWSELHRTRLERLVGCLSTPVPKPPE